MTHFMGGVMGSNADFMKMIEKALRLGAADLFHITTEADGSSG